VSSPHQIKKAVAEYSIDLHQRGWVANHDGNVSARLDQEARFVITPTATSKRKCSPSSLVLCDLAGKPVGPGKPPSEVALHVGAYAARPDAKAVIHAHPPHASAFALCGIPIAPIAMPEVVVSLGSEIPLIPMLLPKDNRTQAAVQSALTIADVALLAGNGVFAVGEDLEQAYLRVELIEHYARILLVARGLGNPLQLADDDLRRLLEMRAGAGLGPKKPSVASTIRPIVSEEIRRVLGGTK
jgi:L-fuculose-phosphate aldolase